MTAEATVRPTSPPRPADGRSETGGRAGFMLLDIVLALAITGLLAFVVWPLIPHGTTAARQAGYVLEIAAMLKTDRTSATREVREVATEVDVAQRRITSGAGAGRIQLPNDLVLDVLASEVCRSVNGRYEIAFAPDGRTCGAVLRIAKAGRDWKVRVNWLTGYVDILAPGQV